jgi:glutathione S-transferase
MIYRKEHRHYASNFHHQQPNYSSWLYGPGCFLNSGIDVKKIRIPLYRKESKSEILKFSPAGKEPILLDDCLKVWNSLGKRFSETQGWPDEVGRALACSVAAEMLAGFMGVCSYSA